MFPACILIATVAMLTGISGTAMLTPFVILAPSNVRNAAMETLPEAVERIPRRNEVPVERIIITKGGKEYRYRICDQHKGYVITGLGAAMEGLVSVGLGELEMPNLVKRCKIPVAVSAATSVFIIALSVLFASLTDVFALIQHGGLTAVPWNFVAYAAPGAVIGGQLGSKFQGRISSEGSERFISVLFTIIGVAFVYTSVMTKL